MCEQNHGSVLKPFLNVQKTVYVNGKCEKDSMHRLGLARSRVPTRTGKPGKWKGIFWSENFEQTGKFRENHTKYWKNSRFSDKYYLLFLVKLI